MLSNKLLTTSTESTSVDMPQMNYVTALLHADGTNGAQNNTFINQTLPLGAGYNVGYFDGTGDYLSLAYNAALDLLNTSFTIEAWINPTTLKTSGLRIFSTGGGLAGWNSTTGIHTLFQVQDSTGKLSLQLSSNTSTPRNVLTTGTVSANTWTHVAATYNGTTGVSIFINGVQESFTITAPLRPSTNPSATIATIPGEAGASFANFVGYISNFRVLKGVALYTANFAVPTSPLTAITGTSLLTCNNTTFTDSSSNNLAITTNGNASVVNLLQTLTRNGDTTQGSFSPYGNLWSNYFNGASSQTFPALSSTAFGTGDFTVEAWVYLDADPFGQYVIDNRNSSQTTNWAFGFGLGGIGEFRGRLGWYTGSVTYDEPVISTQKHTWTHVVAVRSGTTLSIFINGTRVRTATDTTDYNISSNTARIGARHAILQSTDHLKGYLSNLRIVKSAVYDPSQTTLNVPIYSLPAITNTTLLTCQSNRFVDNSSNNFAITTTGSVQVTKFSPFIPTSSYDPLVLGGSSYFDGTGDYLSLANNELSNFGTDNFTIEGWFFFTNANANALQAMFSNYTTYAVAGSMYWGKHTTSTSGRMSVWIYNQSTSTFYLQEPSMPPQDQWTHYALVRNGNTITIYRNGIATVSASTFSGTTTVGNRPLYIGVAGDNLSTSGFPGYISNYRIVKGTALYTANFTPPTAPLLPISNTSLLLSATNAGVFDSAVKGNWETEGTAQLSTSVKKFGTASLYLTGTTTSRLFHPYSHLYDFALDTFTFEAWIYPTRANTTGTRIFSTGGGTAGWNSTTGIHLLIQTSGGTTSGGQLNAQLATNTTTPTVILNTSIVPINQWSFITVCVIGSTAYVGLNGTVVSGSVATRARPSTNPTVSLGSLVGESSSSLSFQGYMDEVRITKGIARYTGNFTPPTEPFADY